MKLAFITLFFALTTHRAAGEVIDLKSKRLPGLKLSYTNSALLEQVARRNSKAGDPDRTEEIQVTFRCYKKWKVRGRDSTRTYQCDPIEMEVPAPKTGGR